MKIFISLLFVVFFVLSLMSLYLGISKSDFMILGIGILLTIAEIILLLEHKDMMRNPFS